MADAIPVFNIVHISVDMSEEMRDSLNAEYNFYKTLCYALGYSADCNAKVIACVPAVHKDFMFNITRSELLGLVETRRAKLHEQLNSI